MKPRTGENMAGQAFLPVIVVAVEVTNTALNLNITIVETAAIIG